jgi:hypothetical protein
MANALYPFGKAHLLGLATKVDLVADTIKLMIVDTVDIVWDNTDHYVSDLTGAGIVARSGALAGKTVTSGVFDANDVTLTAVTGDSVEAVILYKDTGVDATSPLIGWWDVPTYTPDGGDILVPFNASGLFGI